MICARKIRNNPVTRYKYSADRDIIQEKKKSTITWPIAASLIINNFTGKKITEPIGKILRKNKRRRSTWLTAATF